MYAVEIISTLASKPGLAAKPGTVYPLLARLDKNGAVKASWQASPSGSPRKYYRLTAKGKTALRAQATAWREMTSAIESIMGGPHD